MKLSRRGGGVQPSLNVHVTPVRTLRQRPVASSTPMMASVSPAQPDSLPRARTETLHTDSSVRQLREAFGLGSEEVSALPHRQHRTDPDMEWDEIPRRRSLVRMAMKLSTTICSILYPANPEMLLIALSEEIGAAHGGTAADAKSLWKVGECVKECKDILPRDSPQRAAMLAPICTSLSLNQSKQVRLTSSWFHTIFVDVGFYHS